MEASRLNEVVRGWRGITADTALRLGQFLWTSAEFWVGLQDDYTPRMAHREKLKRIACEVHPKVA